MAHLSADLRMSASTRLLVNSVMNTPATALADLIHSNKFSDPGCPLDVWFRALLRIQTQACDARISSDIPDFMVAIFKRAIGLGFGNQDIAAIFEVAPV
jgi:hypothetical protein